MSTHLWKGGNGLFLRLRPAKFCVHHISNRLFVSKRFADTLNLPKTTFELWGAGKREEDVQKVNTITEKFPYGATTFSYDMK